jgi:hypothetical protein
MRVRDCFEQFHTQFSTLAADEDNTSSYQPDVIGLRLATEGARPKRIAELHSKVIQRGELVVCESWTAIDSMALRVRRHIKTRICANVLGLARMPDEARKHDLASNKSSSIAAKRGNVLATLSRDLPTQKDAEWCFGHFSGRIK